MTDRLRETATKVADVLEEAISYVGTPSWSPSMEAECKDALWQLRAALAENREQPRLLGPASTLRQAREYALEEAARVCELLDVHPELNVYNGGPDWYKHAKRCAAVIRALKRDQNREG